MFSEIIRNYINAFILKELDRAIEKHLSGLVRGIILQVGANDGVTIDPVRKFAVLPKFTSYLLEPVPYIFMRLQKNYNACPQVKLFQQAIVDTEVSEQTFYYVMADDDKDIGKGLFGSFSKKHVESFFTDKKEGQVKIIEEKVSCTTLDKFIQTLGIREVDYLQIDAEGYDLAILKTLNFELIKPTIIQFEHLHINPGKIKEFLELLGNKYGYRSYSHGFDTLCFLPKVGNIDLLLRIIKIIRPSLLSVNHK